MFKIKRENGIQINSGIYYIYYTYAILSSKGIITIFK